MTRDRPHPAVRRNATALVRLLTPCLLRLLFLLLCPFVRVTQAQVTQEWVRYYNGSYWYSWTDEATDVAVDSHGNAYVTGYALESSGWSYTTIKYSPAGEVLWKAHYSWPEGAPPWENSAVMALDQEGNVYISGSMPGDSYDYVTVKYNSAGEEQWAAHYDGPYDYDDDRVTAIALDVSGNVRVTGYSWVGGDYGPFDCVTLKYSSTGQQLWVARYSGRRRQNDSDDKAFAMAVDGAGYGYVAGYTSGIGHDYLIIKYTPDGLEEWVRTYDAGKHDFDEASSVAVDAVGNVYVTGWSIGGYLYPEEDYATIKYSPSGDELWVVRYNGPGPQGGCMDEATALALDGDGNIYVTGSSEGEDGRSDYATVKYDSSGVEQWVERYVGPPLHGDRALEIAVGRDGSIYVTGESHGFGTSTDYTTLKYSSAGTLNWNIRFNGPYDNNDERPHLALGPSGYVYVAGGSFVGYPRLLDYVTLKYGQTNPVLVSLLRADALFDEVRLEWLVQSVSGARVQRREAGRPWTIIGEVAPNGRGHVAFQDRNVGPGLTYDYRLALTLNEQTVYGGEITITVPETHEFALNPPRPNPSSGELTVSFALPTGSPAQLEVFDVRGRRVLTQTLSGLSPGRHLLLLGSERRFHAGVYTLRLIQASRVRSAKAVVVR